MPSSARILEACDLTKVYGEPGERRRHWWGRIPTQPQRRPAVDSVSFTVERGELFVIMGLSGSGKSTVLRMLNRLVEPTTGTVVVDGTDISAAPARELRQIRNSTINMVFRPDRFEETRHEHARRRSTERDQGQREPGGTHP